MPYIEVEALSQAKGNYTLQRCLQFLDRTWLGPPSRPASEVDEPMRIDETPTAPEPIQPTTEPPTQPAPEPPIQTTEPPIQTTEPPIQTTEPPIQTTEPPIQTTEPPIQTTWRSR